MCLQLVGMRRNFAKIIYVTDRPTVRSGGNRKGQKKLLKTTVTRLNFFVLTNDVVMFIRRRSVVCPDGRSVLKPHAEIADGPDRESDGMSRP